MKHIDLHTLRYSKLPALLRTPEGQRRVALIMLWAIIAVYILVMSYEVILRYMTFEAGAFDLGNLDQVLWNTIHGRLFQFTNQGSDYYGPPTRLAIHFEPIILLVALLYLLPGNPILLLIFQTLAIVSGAWPVFVLTRKYLPTWPLFAPLLVVAYLLAPSLLALNLFDFHPVSLATPCLLYAVLALTYGRYGWFLVACVLASACKEDIPLAVAALGILVIWKYKLPRLGALVILGGMCWYLVAFLVIIPHFYPGAVHNNYWYRYEALGSSPGAAILNILLHPWVLFTTLFTLERFYYLANLFRSTGFLCLLAPEWLLPALPSLAVNLLSTYEAYYSGGYHYNAAIIPFVILAAIHGTRRFYIIWLAWRGETEEEMQGDALVERSQKAGRPKKVGWSEEAGRPQELPLRYRMVGAHFIIPWMRALAAKGRTFLVPYLIRLKHVYIKQWLRLCERLVPLAKTTSLPRLQWFAGQWVIFMVLLNIVIMLPTLTIFLPDHLPGDREQHIQQLLARIPPNASVSAGGNINAHLSQRLYITVFPAITFSTSKSINNTVQYIIVDEQNITPEDRIGTANRLNQLVNTNQFRVLARAEGVILLERRTT